MLLNDIEWSLHAKTQRTHVMRSQRLMRRSNSFQTRAFAYHYIRAHDAHWDGTYSLVETDSLGTQTRRDGLDALTLQAFLTEWTTDTEHKSLTVADLKDRYELPNSFKRGII